MKTKALCLIIAILLAISMAAVAEAPLGITEGTLMTAPSPCNITAVLPKDMKQVYGYSDSSYIFANDYMLIDMAPIYVRSYDEYYANNLGSKFVEAERLTINGLDARKYSPVESNGIACIYAVQEGSDGCILSIAFNPRDKDDTEKNNKCIEQILSGLRSRGDTYKSDQGYSGWTTAFSHTSLGLMFRMPQSMIKLAIPSTENSIVEYQNDYIMLLVFGYEATIDDYIKEFNMTAADYYISEDVVNGVNVYIFEPKSDEVSTDAAYIVAQGNGNLIMELIVGENSTGEQDECWYYINGIISTIASLSSIK